MTASVLLSHDFNANFAITKCKMLHYFPARFPGGADLIQSHQNQPTQGEQNEFTHSGNWRMRAFRPGRKNHMGILYGIYITHIWKKARILHIKKCIGQKVRHKMPLVDSREYTYIHSGLKKRKKRQAVSKIPVPLPMIS